MCSPSPPPPPDVAGQAAAQGVANEQAARVQGRINNPNRVGPGGSQTVTWDGDTPTVTNTLSPEEQAIYNQSQTNRQGLGGLAGQGIDSLQGVIGKPLDLSGAPSGGMALKPMALPQTLDRNGLPAAPTAYQGASNLPNMPASAEALRQQVIDAQMQRSNTAIDRQADQTKADLIARGLRPGTEAYSREMDTLGRQRNDAQAQAEANATTAVQAAFNQDLARRQQGYNEGITDANTKFGEGMALRGQATGEQAQQFGQGASNVSMNAQQQNQQFNQQNQSRQQAIAEILARRQVPLNEITALMSGSQTGGAPAATGGGGGGGFNTSTVAPAPVWAAANAGNNYQTDVYNQQVATANQQQSSAMSAILTAAMMY